MESINIHQQIRMSYNKMISENPRVMFSFFIYLHSSFPEDEQSLYWKHRFQIYNAVINPKALWTFWTTAEA